MINKIPAYFKTRYFHSVHIVLTQPGRWLSVKLEKKIGNPNQQYSHSIGTLAISKQPKQASTANVFKTIN
jgi:hypothetical protein